MLSFVTILLQLTFGVSFSQEHIFLFKIFSTIYSSINKYLVFLMLGNTSLHYFFNMRMMLNLKKTISYFIKGINIVEKGIPSYINCVRFIFIRELIISRIINIYIDGILLLIIILFLLIIT
ncbi:hypothetical protein HAV_00047 [Candidatus Hepatincola sp. Av]